MTWHGHGFLRVCPVIKMQFRAEQQAHFRAEFRWEFRHTTPRGVPPGITPSIFHKKNIYNRGQTVVWPFKWIMFKYNLTIAIYNRLYRLSQLSIWAPIWWAEGLCAKKYIFLKISEIIFFEYIRLFWS